MSYSSIKRVKKYGGLIGEVNNPFHVGEKLKDVYIKLDTIFSGQLQYKYRISMVGWYSATEIFSGSYTLNLSRTDGTITHRLGFCTLFSNGDGNSDSRNLEGFRLMKKNGLYELYDRKCLV